MRLARLVRFSASTFVINVAIGCPAWAQTAPGPTAPRASTAPTGQKDHAQAPRKSGGWHIVTSSSADKNASDKNAADKGKSDTTANASAGQAGQAPGMGASGPKSAAETLPSAAKTPAGPGTFAGPGPMAGTGPNAPNKMGNPMPSPGANVPANPAKAMAGAAGNFPRNAANPMAPPSGSFPANGASPMGGPVGSFPANVANPMGGPGGNFPANVANPMASMGGPNVLGVFGFGLQAPPSDAGGMPGGFGQMPMPNAGTAGGIQPPPGNGAGGLQNAAGSSKMLPPQGIAGARPTRPAQLAGFRAHLARQGAIAGSGMTAGRNSAPAGQASAGQIAAPVARKGGYVHYDPTAFIPRERQPGGAMSTNYNAPGTSRQSYSYQSYGARQVHQSTPSPSAGHVRVQPGADQMYTRGSSYGKTIRF